MTPTRTAAKLEEAASKSAIKAIIRLRFISGSPSADKDEFNLPEVSGCIFETKVFWRNGRTSKMRGVYTGHLRGTRRSKSAKNIGFYGIVNLVK